MVIFEVSGKNMPGRTIIDNITVNGEEYGTRAKNYLKKNYFSKPDIGKAFSLKENGRSGLKSNVQYAIYGLGALALERTSDLYANSSLRDKVINWYSYLPGDFNTGVEGFARDISMGGIQNNIYPMLNLSSGDFTDAVATVGAILTGASLLYLGAKKYARDSAKRAGHEPEKVTRRTFLEDTWDSMKNSPISLGVISASLAGGLASALSGGKEYAAAAVSSVYKTAKTAPVTAKRRSNSFLSNVENKFNAWLDSDV